jgi:hypothetical protein
LFFVLLVLPLSQRPFARWGHPYPHSDAVSICVVLVRNATPHRCDVRRRRQLHGVGRRLRAGTASLPRTVRRTSSAARRPQAQR